MLADIISAGWVWGNVVAIILMIVALLFFIGGIVASRNSRIVTSRNSGFAVMIIAFICMLIIAGGWLWASWPLKYEYHHWVDQEGVVTNVGQRFVSGGKGIVNQRFVFTLNGKLFGVDDTRASLVHKG